MSTFARMPALANAACRSPESAAVFDRARAVGNDSHVTAAKAICARCWDRPECLVWGLEHETVGIWGGHGSGGLREMRKKFGIPMREPATHREQERSAA